MISGTMLEPTLRKLLPEAAHSSEQILYYSHFSLLFIISTFLALTAID